MFFFFFVDDPFKDDLFGKADVLGEYNTHDDAFITVATVRIFIEPRVKHKQSLG